MLRKQISAAKRISNLRDPQADSHKPHAFNKQKAEKSWNKISWEPMFRTK